MQMRIAAGDQSQGYYDLVTSMYGKVSPSKRRLVAEILDATDPLDFEPTANKKPREDVISSFYDSPEMQIAPKSHKQMNADFLNVCPRAKAAVIVMLRSLLQDGRRYVGALQFGDARLQDYQAATDYIVYAG